MFSLIKKIGIVKMTLISVVSSLLFISLIVFAIKSTHVDMSSLYKDIPPTDRAAVLNALNSLGIEYKLDEGEIFIDSNRVREVRMLLAAEGLPNSGSIVGYEIFNKSEAFGTSSFIQNVNLIRALEGELSRTITSFDNIQTARVHLVIPKKELFSNKEINKPKASVMLRMNTNSTLSHKQISAIIHLISSSIQGLDVNNITLVSSDGKPFKLPDDINKDSIKSSLQDYKLETERRLKDSIENLVGKFVGIDKVKAEVNVDLDLEHLTSDSEVFNPDGQVVRSIQSNEENSSSTDNSGSVSVANNIPNSSNSGAAGAGAGANTNEKKEEVINYEISREIIKKIKEVGEIKRLSIAVLIDGVYTHDKDTNKSVYTPHNANVIEKLHSLVASAVGFNTERGDVLEIANMQFSTESIPQDITTHEIQPSLWQEHSYDIIRLIAICIVILLLSLLVVRPLLIKLFVDARKDASTQEADLNNHNKQNAEEEEEEKPLLKKVNDVISNNPELATSMLRSWITEEKND